MNDHEGFEDFDEHDTEDSLYGSTEAELTADDHDVPADDEGEPGQ